MADLQAEACGCDPDQVAVRLTTLDEELAEIGEQREQQRKVAWELERAAWESDGSAAAAAKADERQALVAGIRDEVEQYLTLAVAQQLLVQAIESYSRGEPGTDAPARERSLRPHDRPFILRSQSGVRGCR